MAEDFLLCIAQRKRLHHDLLSVKGSLPNWQPGTPLGTAAKFSVPFFKTIRKKIDIVSVSKIFNFGVF